jgi:parvulin-like peptidyl-prolyl isomerase
VQIIAKVVDIAISQKDLAREKACGGTVEQALKRLVDRCLILKKAELMGFTVSDEEFDIALMEILDEENPFGLPPGSIQDMDAFEMETLIRRNIIIRKYVASICPDNQCIPEEKLSELYKEQISNFCRDEMVRCSHIFIRGDDALDKISKIRESIHSPQDFIEACKACSDCPSNECCGDLGYFPRGKLFPEIDEVAFSLQQGEISQPFKSPEGYHILMLTDRKCASAIPFSEIKDSLSEHIIQMEREYFLMRHISDLYEEFKHQILIYDDALK